jgi:hypothetical protein
MYVFKTNLNVHMQLISNLNNYLKLETTLDFGIIELNQRTRLKK